MPVAPLFMLVRRHVRLLAYLALIAMLGLSLGPIVSRALNVGRTPVGPAHEAGELHQHHGASAMHGAGHHDSQPGDDAPHDPLDHCGLCAIAGAPCAPSSPPTLRAAEVPSSCVPASRIERCGRGRSRWSRARPRGPPAAA